MWIVTRKPEDRPSEADSVSEKAAEVVKPESEPAIDDRKMIVVLPFDNLGPPEQEYFADGMTEEITSRLATADELGVISRTSAMQYKDKRPPIQQIGEELGVGYVLEGTVRWAGGSEEASRVRITTQLIEVENDTHLWAENYDRVLDDIFQVQSDIAGEVIDQLGVTLLEPERQAMTERPTENLEAYQAYLRGTDLVGELDEVRLARALEMFRRAVDLDPDFISAWARLAKAGASRYHFGYDRSEELKSEVRSAAERALELDPDSSEAHTAMGFYHYHVNKDYGPATESFNRAIEIQPDNSDALEGNALVLRRISRWDESIEVHEQAKRYNPKDASLIFNLGDSYMFARDYDRAASLFQRCIEIQPDFFYACFYRAFTFLLSEGDLGRARAMLESMPDTEAPDPYWVWWLVELAEDNTEAALALADRIGAETYTLGATVHAPSLMKGLAYLYAGQPTLAKPHLEEAKTILESDIAQRQDAFRYRSALAVTLAGLGQREDAVSQGKRAVAEYPVSKDSAWGPRVVEDLALTYVLVEEPEEAIEQLDYLLSIPSQISVPWIESDPRWEALREHPAYAVLLDKYR